MLQIVIIQVGGETINHLYGTHAVIKDVTGRLHKS